MSSIFMCPKNNNETHWAILGQPFLTVLLLGVHLWDAKKNYRACWDLVVENYYKGRFCTITSYTVATINVHHLM